MMLRPPCVWKPEVTRMSRRNAKSASRLAGHGEGGRGVR